jgi:hypothetical protein
MEATSIISVVAMIPHTVTIARSGPEVRLFVVEKPGLDVAHVGGITQELTDE